MRDTCDRIHGLIEEEENPTRTETQRWDAFDDYTGLLDRLHEWGLAFFYIGFMLKFVLIVSRRSLLGWSREILI